MFAKTNLIYLRTRSLLLLLRVHDISAEWQQITQSMHGGMFAPQRPEWFNVYWPLLEQLTGHASNLDSEMLKASFFNERELCVALKFCLVVTLSAKAQMHWLLHRDHEESAQRALDVVMEVVTVTRTIKDNEFLLLDPLLGVSVRTPRYRLCSRSCRNARSRSRRARPRPLVCACMRACLYRSAGRWSRASS